MQMFADTSLNEIFPQSSHMPSLLDSCRGPDLRVYRLFMVWAIGANILSKGPDSPNVAALRACAAAHFPAALRSDELVSRR
jgi:hypothetical protein